jgi:dihydrofolate reductase
MEAVQPIIVIAAMSADGVIGRGDGMPWDVPAEYAQYLAQVSEETMIMGRRSFEIFGRDIPRARKIVVSRSRPSFPDAEAAGSLAEAIELARQTPRRIFIGGGASIYREALECADRMHLSVIHGQFRGDTYFPEFDRDRWTVARHEVREGYDYFEYVASKP